MSVNMALRIETLEAKVEAQNERLNSLASDIKAIPVVGTLVQRKEDQRAAKPARRTVGKAKR